MDFTDDQLNRLREVFTDGFKTVTLALRAELGEMRTGIDAKIQASADGLRDEIHATSDALRNEIHAVRDELRSEIRSAVHDSETRVLTALHDNLVPFEIQLRTQRIELDSLHASIDQLEERVARLERPH